MWNEVVGTVSIPVLLAKRSLSGVPVLLEVMAAVPIIAAIAAAKPTISTMSTMPTIRARTSIVSGPAVATSRVVAISSPLSVR